MSISYHVRVYWGSQGYGGATVCRTLDEARDKAKWLSSPGMGYGTPQNPIHIIRVVTPEIVEVITNRPDVQSKSEVAKE